MTDLGAVEARLRQILEPYRTRLSVGKEGPEGIYLELPGFEGKPWGYVAGTRAGKRYVSFYLMALSDDPQRQREPVEISQGGWQGGGGRCISSAAWSGPSRLGDLHDQRRCVFRSRGVGAVGESYARVDRVPDRWQGAIPIPIPIPIATHDAGRNHGAIA